MNKNAWILWALILIVPGAVSLSYHFAQKNALEDRLIAAEQAVDENPAAEEYLSMYDSWFALSADEKAENPWGQDPYGGPEIQKRVRDGQADRLMADLIDLDKGLMHYPDQLAETLYGANWENTLKQYRKDQEKAEMILIASIFLLAGGGLILTGGLGKILFLACFRKSSEDENVEECDSEENPAEVAKEPDTKETPSLAIARTQPLSDMDKVISSIAEKKEKVSDEDTENEPDSEPVRLGYFEPKKKAAQTSEESSKTSSSIDAAPLPSVSELTSASTSTAVAAKPVKDSYFGWAIDEDEDPSLENLMTTEPLTKELTELTEEMSAIREFAAQQQDQVRKLQDGYDWMIVRRFCMRIIRCVDNIDDRISHLDEQSDELLMCLEDIRDELIFALESSGVEQFNPDLNMPFKGLEKYAEAVRQRIETQDESLVGCIAEVARPGYQYLISEEEVKVVRCAQVKLYDLIK